jgi:hypothetical protein
LEPKTPTELEAAAKGSQSPGQAVPKGDSNPTALQDLSADSARLLADAALALFAIYAVVVAFDIFPLRLADPLWLITASSALVNAVSIPLAGVVFLHLAAAIAPYTNWIHQRRQNISRLAAWAALGFLLLVPLLGFATWRGIANVSAASQKQTAGYTRSAQNLLQAIDRAATPRELQQSMVKLQGPQISDQDLNQPLAVLKKAGTLLVKQALAASVSQLPKPDSQAYKPLYIQTLRTALLALVSSIAFAAVVWNPLKRQTLLRSVFSKSPKPNRGSFYRSLQKLIEKAREATKKDAQRAEFLAILSRRQKDSDRAKAKRERAMKRNAEMQRKMAAVREKKRLQAERQARKRRDG